MWSTKEVEEVKHVLPEHKLLAAILKRAVYDLSGRYAESDENTAVEWFESDEEIDEESFTFSYICEHLNLDKARYRKRIK